MSFFGKNIKKIRTVKKLSQTAFADIFNMKRGSISAYEEERAEAKIDTIIGIAEYFKLSLDQLLTSELTINEIYHLDSINKKRSDTKFDQEKNNITYISIGNKDNFIQNYESSDFLNKLPKIKLPINTKDYIAFECFDSSMLGQYSGIKKGDILLAQIIKLDDIKDLLKLDVLIVLHKSELVIGTANIKEEKLILSPVNMNFQKHEMFIGEIKKLWLIKSIITDTFLNENLIKDKIEKLEYQVNSIGSEIINLKSKVLNFKHFP